jgi:hypothetical protein
MRDYACDCIIIHEYAAAMSIHNVCREKKIITDRNGAAKREWGRVMEANQNQPLRYASHQLNAVTGMVAKSAHQSGRKRSQARPSTRKLAQKIFFSMPIF